MPSNCSALALTLAGEIHLEISQRRLGGQSEKNSRTVTIEENIGTHREAGKAIYIPSGKQTCIDSHTILQAMFSVGDFPHPSPLFKRPSKEHAWNPDQKPQNRCNRTFLGVNHASIGGTVFSGCCIWLWSWLVCSLGITTGHHDNIWKKNELQQHGFHYAERLAISIGHVSKGHICQNQHMLQLQLTLADTNPVYASKLQQPKMPGHM